ncbi:Predicted DNA-binding transcriptional regulator YafY, contains an HTH and WYL domains [Nonomuraea maritima]|uniref:Predicted DNA-binding transcriptional regulator YafY, contains an HTH and WYL domains n=1 Tax=Nonomuraea maritima TaxID=683260 RepID=A0A1G9Q626_9ACTN|nr:transcriptional regulator [Nonomuraea maritima]SDM06419.1 Predicted DNA-binding transcriptional regulator YafY, contains an HTH and WYL domains [Nonomuraea maritima]
MRADRLVAALLVLQARGQVTAAQLARELEVSVATARRDLEALSAAGVPVYAQPGRGGGWRLLGGARTDLSGLTAHEAQALFLLVGPAAPAAPAVRSALRKLLRALPPTFRADAEAAAGAVVVDPARWGEPERERPAPVEVLQDAVVRRRTLRIGYEGRRGGPAERLVDPWGLVVKDDVWYLLAGTANGRRTFRVDRIARIVVTGETFERPAGFEPAEAWDDVVDAMERRRSALSATVLIDPRFVPILREHFGRHCQAMGTEADGRARVRVAAPDALTVAEQLAGWGGRVEVVEPAEVRAELARIGTELVERHHT